MTARKEAGERKREKDAAPGSAPRRPRSGELFWRDRAADQGPARDGKEEEREGKNREGGEGEEGIQS